ncbi:bifunctional proline dehydrogenase/L-glutamate gamma-semialdehyde dehydrogenase [Cryobacterium sp. 5B3]|uniref:bifunctional proline dehydrogenase/L-glutamate gamma-semialdehyde dehydrogenase n=2 Tax=unclassified Cryobacterium TaxID=2649013 RepID=UPI002AB3670E|nr:bifunctional proline dehydrogenase/L-glutamate gamma-semialdehyde dehydrogenase [Cryobacterium sp. 5B3]MDY7542006.1 bifunctional proline dehydrogenase/L-glutamate gamma-semialdehyde dehydrogenase [Cryobacterium sp. 5B3]MEB0274385.1 bifunctional proline dehydrogenase/L-glutamate gamma-semialdehyde dehydrogenase [Cryobacterium sp. 5B3]
MSNSPSVVHQAQSAEVVTLVRKWLAESTAIPADVSAERLAGVLKDPNGLDFTVGFVDGVMRPQDLMVAGYNLQAVAKKAPGFLPGYLRGAIGLGGVLGPVLPWVVIPAARKVLRQMVGHLVVDATPDKLGPAIASLRASGNRLNINLLGEAVLGEKEAMRRLEGTRDLLARPDVDYVSIKVSSIASQLSMWSFDEAVTRVVERLTPLYELAAASAVPKFINLDMEEYRDLDLTIAVFERILDQPRLLGLEAGIVLQAYLPDALGALQGLTHWAQGRRAAGGAPIKVRVVKGANLAMEHVDAIVHDWPLATYGTKQDADTNYKRVLNWALTPQNTDAVRIGVAGHNLFDVAWAHLLAKRRGVDDRVEFEMLLGMATSQAEAVSRDVGRLLLYTPVVNPAEFDVAISYLIRRLEENASQDNFMSAVFELTTSPPLFEREKERFLASLRSLETSVGPEAFVPAPNRTQDRSAVTQLEATESAVDAAQHTDDDLGLTNAVLGFTRGSLSDTAALLTHAGPGNAAAGIRRFHNEPDTDPALPANRAWGRRILAQVEGSRLGIDTILAARVDTEEQLDAIIDTVTASGDEWGQRPGGERAAILHRAGLALAANRDRLIEVMAAETGKTIAEGDPEVSEAIDFAHYYAESARALDAVQGAIFVPPRLTVVTPPWNFPVAISAGGVLAALAAGSGVIVKPAKLAQRSGAVMVEALWEAGVPRDLLALVDLADRELGTRLIGHPSVDRVILTGAYETAQLFRSFREDLPLLAETSGKNAIIVTPSADLDLAAADVVKSAFGHAGQKCSAASLVILVGSVARSERFLGQLVDAATSLRVGRPSDPVTQMGPLIEPANGKLLHALTELGVGESWLVEPKQLDEDGALWSPGIRTGVAPGSYFHLTEFFGPVLGVMHARTLEEAIRFQNAVDYGLTSGLHSLDPEELATWLETIEAGNLYVNRGITGAIVQRQPFGGWKRSSVGAGTKAGGPNYLYGLGSWVTNPGRNSSTLHLRGLEPRVTQLIEGSQAVLDYADFDVLRRSALSDALAWREEFAMVRDVSELGVERNLFRYRALPVTVRLAEDGTLSNLLRVLIAATLSKSRFSVSSAVPMPPIVRGALAEREIPVTVESDAEWLARAAAGGITTSRVRLIGGGPLTGATDAAAQLAHALRGSPDVAVYAHPVTQAGRVELLPFLREQAISITAHRFGNPSTLSVGII